ncbi:alpha-(1,6)-fucosyltransferase isoform X1 [Lates japonicus]|uniref:Alpha-(1,6)-fucosyltransferase isoform X1 n=1 Tax=Lates japonicus TaxID=270547 RepID=A0AAD3RBR0_LATJO|nr:alpha-(1,6)-fucosyltransferase isoform X1 [Lates japonicus]
MRRTDKESEARLTFHPIEEYMLHVESSSNISGMTSMYPDYEFISDNTIWWSAGLLAATLRTHWRSHPGHPLLSQTDFLVCTFSLWCQSTRPNP